MFEETSVTTSNDSFFSLFIFTISRNGAFSIRFVLTVPVAATPTALKCLSKAGLTSAELNPYQRIAEIGYNTFGVAITHNLNPNVMGLLCMHCFAPCFPK